MLLGTLRLHTSSELQELLDAGLPLDTADVYGARPGETQARLGRPAQTKVGLVRTGATGQTWRPNGTAKHLEAQAHAAHEALGSLPTLLLHAIDPAVGLDRSWRALKRLKAAGITARLGLCNAPHHAILRAAELGELEVVQVELSPHDTTALETGVIRRCLELGIEVQAHSPLGGWRRTNRSVRAWRQVCRDFAISPERLTLRWLASLGVIPVVGCTRLETLEDARGPVPDEAIEAAHAALPLARRCLRRPTAPKPSSGHVVLIAGPPAAGKTTLARDYEARGYTRLNRDELGGTLKGLATRLEPLLGSVRHVVSDNTWSDRRGRARMVEIAHRQGCRVTAIEVPTPLDQCAIQAVRRILDDGEGLPMPDALRADPRPHWFGPDALFRQRARWEPLTDDEGLEIELAAPPVLAWGSGAATFVSLDALERGTFAGPVYGVFRAPDAPRQARVQAALERHPLADHRICPHPPGPPVCWCRPPLPGMVVDLLRTHDLDPEACTFVGGPAERTLAERLGARFSAG